MVPMAKNYEAIYMHSSETNKIHRFTQKYCYTDDRPDHTMIVHNQRQDEEDSQIRPTSNGRQTRTN